MNEKKKTGLRITAVILAIVIVAVAVFLSVWFTNCTVTKDNGTSTDGEDNTTQTDVTDDDNSGTAGSGNQSGSSTADSGKTDEGNVSDNGNSADTAAQGNATENSTSAGSTGDETADSSAGGNENSGTADNGSAGEEAAGSGNDNSSTDEAAGSGNDNSSTDDAAGFGNDNSSTDDAAGSGEIDGKVGSLTRELTETDIENLTGALQNAKVYNSSYYAVSTKVLTDNLESTSATVVSKVAFDLEDTCLSVTEDYIAADEDYEDIIYIFTEGASGTVYEDYTDNLDASNSYKSDMSWLYDGVFDAVYGAYTTNFVGNMFNLSSEDGNMATAYDVAAFMQKYLYFASEIDGYYISDENLYNGVYEYGLYNGTGVTEVYDSEYSDEIAEGDYIYVYSYIYELVYTDDGGNIYTIQYASSTAIYVSDGYVTERSTQEELIISDYTGTSIYDTTYENLVIMTYVCDDSLFDVDFTDYVSIY